MRERSIELLAYPRDQVRNNVELDHCSHNGLYAEGDRECQNCDYEMECNWLYHNDEFAALKQKSIEDLVDALEFVAGYIVPGRKPIKLQNPSNSIPNN